MAGMRQDRQSLVPEVQSVRFRRGYPGKLLRPFVRNFWASRPAGTSRACTRQRIVPDGCIDVLFVRGGPTETCRSYVVGMMTRPIFEDMAPGAEYLGIRFAPGGFTHLFGCPAHEFTDQMVPLDSLSLSFISADRIAESPGIEASFSMLEDCLNQRIVAARPNPALGKALELISACQGAVTAAQLSRIASCSSRHLLRIFRESVGVGPKTYCRIVRFKTALRALRRRPRPDLLRVALDAGYYDQAHFIHEFNAFYGSSPSAVMSVSYNTQR
jgi:AraC-like DNA-binding protein